jgi:hypothetical protein
VQTLTKDKNSPFMHRVKELEINRMGIVVNQLNNTDESHRLVCKLFVDKIRQASQESSEMLHYALFKIVDSLSTLIQDEAFNHLIESQPHRYARLMSLICVEIDDFKHLLRSMFFKTCPPVMGKIVSEGLDTDAFLHSMGFVWKGSKTSLVSAASCGCGCYGSMAVVVSCL